MNSSQKQFYTINWKLFFILSTLIGMVMVVILLITNGSIPVVTKTEYVETTERVLVCPFLSCYSIGGREYYYKDYEDCCHEKELTISYTTKKQEIILREAMSSIKQQLGGWYDGHIFKSNKVIINLDDFWMTDLPDKFSEKRFLEIYNIIRRKEYELKVLFSK